MNYNNPSKKELLEAYHRLDSNHPRHLLPLETRLPDELQYQRRDGYRLIMTMILSQRTDDYSLSVSLGKLFSAHPTLESLRGLTTWNAAKDLLRRHGFKVDGPAEYNVHRFWALLRLCSGKWCGTIESDFVDTLKVERGYGPKFIRTLCAYHLGDRNILPLDGKGFDALRKAGLYAQDATINQVRTDIEHKLIGENSIALIDFHELLRFRAQTGGRTPEHFNNNDMKVIIGWNAWRLLCSLERMKITEDWIHEHLVKDNSIAKKLWDFFREIT